MPAYEPARRRFWRFVRKTETCWLWTGATTDGYGKFGGEAGAHGRHTVVNAHRFAWEQLRGPIPDGYVLDHLCGNRGCVNPDHLDCVTMNENARRSNRHRVRFEPTPDPDPQGTLF